MTLKGNTKFKGKLTCGLKNDLRNLVNFHASIRKSENLHFDGFLLSKAYKDLDEKVKKIYVSWHWRVMQSLKKNWLLVPKMTWGIWWTLTRWVDSLKICTLKGCLCRNTLGSKNDMRNLVKFNPSSGQSENLHFERLIV